MENTIMARSNAVVPSVRGWRRVWHGTGEGHKTTLYFVDGAWKILDAQTEGTEFTLPSGFSARLNGMGGKTLSDGFGHEAQLVSEMVDGEMTPVIIDINGDRYELVAA